eukprot:4200870-Lingulodinium_polyedra.AAC.1
MRRTIGGERAIARPGCIRRPGLRCAPTERGRNRPDPQHCRSSMQNHTTPPHQTGRIIGPRQ